MKKEVSLSVLERVEMLGILPTQFKDYFIAVQTDNFRKELVFTEEEMDEYKISTKEGRVQWDIKANDKTRTFLIPSLLYEELRQIVLKLLKDSKFTLGLIGVYKQLGLPCDGEPVEEIKE